MNIGNRTSVKSEDILHIEHRIAKGHRYRFGGRRPSAARRVNSTCLLPPGSGNNRLIVQPWHTACVRGSRGVPCAFDLRARYPEIFTISMPACVRRPHE